jgi:hypothetical protein
MVNALVKTKIIQASARSTSKRGAPLNPESLMASPWQGTNKKATVHATCIKNS